MHEQKGYEMEREIGVDADFLRMVVPIFEIINRPLLKRQKMRVVIDYDPREYKVKFRFIYIYRSRPNHRISQPVSLSPSG